MMSKEEILKKLTQCKKQLQVRYKIKTIGLFGSFARGEQNTRSDVDVLVEVDPSIGLGFVTLANDIEKIMGTPTDVVSLMGIKPRYRKIVESEVIYV